jgi:hypothetical protein
MEAFLGMLFGGLFRLTPEFLKFWDRQLERIHELRMQDKQLEFHKIEAFRPEATAMDVAGAQMMADMLERSVSKQYKAEPVLSPFVRPMVTFTLTALYALPLVMQWRSFGNDDLGLYSGILAFWFADRALKK